MRSRRTDIVCAALIFVAAAGYFLSFRPWTRPVLLDAATWDYMAIQIARGLVPYRDVFLHKTPASALMGAMAVRIGAMLGIEPVFAVHGLFLLFGALAPVLLFALCRTRTSRGVAITAAVAMLAYDEWVVAALEGCRPKVDTVVFGLASMLAAERDWAFSSSLLGGLSVLTWQPGLAFLAGAWATILHRGERRPLRLLAIAATSLVPSVLVLGWLAAHGALGDFFQQAVLFNLTYIDEKARTPFGTLHAFARTIGEWNDVEALLAPVAVAGIVFSHRTRRARGGALLPLSLLVSGAIYLAMTFVSYQSWPDAILLAAIVPALLAAGVHALLRTRLTAIAATVVAISIFAVAAIPDLKPKFHPPIDFATQRQRLRALAAGITPADRVIAVSVPEFLIHTDRRNGWKWPYMWFGVDDFAAAHTPGGFDAILADLDGNRPAMMLVGRLWAGPQRARFERWAATLYDVRTVRLFPHTRRPLRVYTLRG